MSIFELIKDLGNAVHAAQTFSIAVPSWAVPFVQQAIAAIVAELQAYSASLNPPTKS